MDGRASASSTRRFTSDRSTQVARDHPGGDLRSEWLCRRRAASPAARSSESGACRGHLAIAGRESRVFRSRAPLAVDRPGLRVRAPQRDGRAGGGLPLRASWLRGGRGAGVARRGDSRHRPLGRFSFEERRLLREVLRARPSRLLAPAGLRLRPAGALPRRDRLLARDRLARLLRPGGDPPPHHPRRATAFFAYGIDGHRHLPEIVESLSAIGEPAVGRIIFQTHSAPLVRGIFVTATVPLRAEMSKEKLKKVFEAAYGNEFFVRLVDGSPDVAVVKGTNFADIGVAVEGNVAKVFVAIDNLVKGAAGQAIQAMNILFGLPEPTGLKMSGVYP